MEGDGSFIGSILNTGSMIDFFRNITGKERLVWVQDRYPADGFAEPKPHQKGNGDDILICLNNLAKKYDGQKIEMDYGILGPEMESLRWINAWLAKDLASKDVPWKAVRVLKVAEGYTWTVEFDWIKKDERTIRIRVWHKYFAAGCIDAIRLAEATIRAAREQMARE